MRTRRASRFAQLFAIAAIAVATVGCGLGATSTAASLPVPSVGPAATAGPAAAQTRGAIAAAMSAVAVQLGDATRPYRPAESGRLLNAPRAVYQVVLPDQPDAGFIVVYEFPDATAAAEAATDQAAYLATGPARVQTPFGTRHVMRLIGSTVVLYSWVPDVVADQRQPEIQPALETLGVGVPIPS